MGLIAVSSCGVSIGVVCAYLVELLCYGCLWVSMGVVCWRCAFRFLY